MALVLGSAVSVKEWAPLLGKLHQNVSSPVCKHQYISWVALIRLEGLFG